MMIDEKLVGSLVVATGHARCDDDDDDDVTV